MGSRTRVQKLSHATLWLGTSTLSRMSTPGRRLQNAHPRGEITSVPLSPLACVYTCNHMFLQNVLFLHFLKEIQTARYPASSSPCVPVIAQAHTSHAEDRKPRKADSAVGALGSRGLQNRTGVWRGRGGQVGRRGPPCPSTPTAQIEPYSVIARLLYPALCHTPVLQEASIVTQGAGGHINAELPQSPSSEWHARSLMVLRPGLQSACQVSPPLSKP